VSDDFPDRVAVESWLSDRAKKPVKIRVRRNERAIRLLAIAYENAKLLFNQKERKPNGVSALQQVLSLPQPPISIEGLDVSNLGDSAPAVSLVHFEEGEPVRGNYRLYYPKTVSGQDDFAMIFEVVERRLRDSSKPLPELLVIDGGVGQLNAAVKAREKVAAPVALCSIAKAKTERHFAKAHVERSQERIFVPNRKNPIILREGDPALRLLQRVRDEAHRFAVKSHRRRRAKLTLTSLLEEIPSVGEKTKHRLLTSFGDLDRIRSASIEELIAVGLTLTQADNLQRALRAPELSARQKNIES